MSYNYVDSSGTDDDLPSTHQNRYERDAHVAGNGRLAIAGSTSYPRMHNNDLETEIRNTEREAYYHILRAFTAQSDGITWENMEDLIPNLRKELRVSDEEHRELLSVVNNDRTIQRIREWRNANGIQSCGITSSHPVHESVQSPTFSASRKKQRTGRSVGPPPPLHPPMQPTSSTFLRGPPNVRRGRKPKGMPHPPTARGGRPLDANYGSAFGTSEPTDDANLDQLIGRKVWTWWPEHKKFYEAVIKDLKEGRHALLVYDSNTPAETWERVDLKDISPQEIIWDSDDPRISQTVNRTGQGRGSKKPSVRRGAVSGDGRDLTKKDLFLPQNGISRKGSSDIELLHTDTLIKQVEKLFSGSHPDATVVEKAKKVLKEHEQALIEAIARLKVPSELLHTDTLIKQVEKVFSVSNPDATVVEKAKKALKEHEQALIDAIAMLEVPSDSEDEGHQPFSQGHLMDQELGWTERQYDGIHGDGRVQIV